MKNIHILYYNFISKDSIINIGGIETYIQLLASALYRYYNLNIYFPTTENYIIKDNTFIAYGIKCKDINELQQIIKSDYLNPDDIVIFATDQIIPKISHLKIIGIQHGIYWDLPTRLYRKNKLGIIKSLFKLYDNFKNFKRSDKYSKLVCVDNNFLNWKRTLSAEIIEDNYKVILNCAADSFFQLAPIDLNKNKITILFPRRFVELRGCLLFAMVAKKMLHKFDYLSVIIAGEGPLENKMKEILPSAYNVQYTKAIYSQMPAIINSSEIIIVPSLGSEGSSLSVIEGMAAGRLVIAANIGGINNLIINNFNGLLCSPTYDSIYNLLEKVILNPKQFAEIPVNAKKSAESSLTFDNWSNQWIDFLNSI